MANGLQKARDNAVLGGTFAMIMVGIIIAGIGLGMHGRTENNMSGLVFIMGLSSVAIGFAVAIVNRFSRK